MVRPITDVWGFSNNDDVNDTLDNEASILWDWNENNTWQSLVVPDHNVDEGDDGQGEEADETEDSFKRIFLCNSDTLETKFDVYRISKRLCTIQIYPPPIIYLMLYIAFHRIRYMYVLSPIPKPCC